MNVSCDAAGMSLVIWTRTKKKKKNFLWDVAGSGSEGPFRVQLHSASSVLLTAHL